MVEIHDIKVRGVYFAIPSVRSRSSLQCQVPKVMAEVRLNFVQEGGTGSLEVDAWSARGGK